MDGMNGQFGQKFMRKHNNARGKPLAVPQGDPPVQAFVEFFRHRCDSQGVAIAEMFGDAMAMDNGWLRVPILHRKETDPNVVYARVIHGAQIQSL
jgi:hypothetical protein